MKQPRVVLIGHTCIDTNISEHAVYTGWGSSVLYISQYYQQYQQFTPTIITSYGPDLLDYAPRLQLLPERPNQQKTLQYRNDSSHGTRTQQCFNSTASVPPELSDAMRAALRVADIVIIATLLPNYAADYLTAALAHAPTNSLKVLCPQGYFRSVGSDGAITPTEFAEADKIVPLFDVVIYSQEDHPQAFERARAWATSSGTQVVVTRAEHGATLVRPNGTELHVPTTPIPPEAIIDSVGCGDTFDAALALEYFRSGAMHQALTVANKTAGDKLKAVIAVRE